MTSGPSLASVSSTASAAEFGSRSKIRTWWNEAATCRLGQKRSASRHGRSRLGQRGASGSAQRRRPSGASWPDVWLDTRRGSHSRRGAPWRGICVAPLPSYAEAFIDELETYTRGILPGSHLDEVAPPVPQAPDHAVSRRHAVDDPPRYLVDGEGPRGDVAVRSASAPGLAGPRWSRRAQAGTSRRSRTPRPCPSPL